MEKSIDEIVEKIPTTLSIALPYKGEPMELSLGNQEGSFDIEISEGENLVHVVTTDFDVYGAMGFSAENLNKDCLIYMHGIFISPHQVLPSLVQLEQYVAIASSRSTIDVKAGLAYLSTKTASLMDTFGNLLRKSIVMADQREGGFDEASVKTLQRFMAYTNSAEAFEYSAKIRDALNRKK